MADIKLPQEANILGSALTGSNGDKNRTYTLTGTIVTTGLTVHINQVFLHKGAGLDFTYSSNLITFLNEVFDAQVISIHYFTSLTGAPAGAYCSVVDVQRILLNSFSYSDSTPTNPTETQVSAFIAEATDEIDNLTQHAWREVTVTEEYYDLPFFANPMSDYSTGLEVNLRHRDIRSFDTNEGDKIEIFDGTNFKDWLTTKTEGRSNDFWIDLEQGVFFLKYYHAFYRRKSLRLTYRFGASTVVNDIRRACAMMAAVNLVRFDDNSAALNETGDPTRSPYDSRIANMEKQIMNILNNRQEFFVVS